MGLFMKRFTLGLLFGWMFATASWAQDTPVVRGHFLSDTTGIGKEVPFALTARYNRDLQMLFPDSTYTFAPFEVLRKKYATTRTEGNQSYDSVVYLVATFELDTLQRLRLPVFLVQEKDCVTIFSSYDSLRINHRVHVLPDSVSVERLPLKVNTAYLTVRQLLNYPVLLIIAGVILLACVIAWILFGKKIRLWFALRSLNREYTAFTTRYRTALQELENAYSPRKAEETLVIWKDYMEKLEGNPYTRYTSREIVHHVTDAELAQGLHAIDRSIYGGGAHPREAFQFLLNFTQKRFQLKEHSLRHG
jgi:hypothetical protein